MPEQVPQVAGLLPEAAPVPEQLVQDTAVGTLMVFCNPPNASFKGNAHVVTQVRTARRALPATATTSTHEIAKKIIEDIGKGTGEISLPARPATAAATHAAFKRRMTIAIVGGLFIAVFENFISLIRLFEETFRGWIICVAIWMKLLRLATVGFFYFLRRGPFRDPERFVGNRVLTSKLSPLERKNRPAKSLAGLD